MRQIRLGEQTQGLIPASQLATGAGTVGNIPVDQGDDTVVWAVPTGGSSCGCCHEHRRERFVALGDTPETFTLADPPTGVTSVYLGSPAPLALVDPTLVTVTGSDVAPRRRHPGRRQ